MDQTMTGWVVNLVQLAVVGVLGFLVRNAFEGVAKSIEGFGKKLDEVQSTIAKADGDRRVLEQRVHTLEQSVEKLERELREVSEGIAR